ncbi:hypothetical protein RND81_11G032600 [Saponaria officinalis]|uniref:F-box domain-containing protein n=1 Tax=Saponaria officinalis TaxID=3572 RepID=A0AAW1HJ12_SAPOF
MDLRTRSRKSKNNKMSKFSKRRLNMFDRLPECLLIGILSLLPIKSLFHLKRVNKLCYNIIKSPYFISKHLKRNNDRHNNCIIAQFVVTQAGELEPSMVWLDDEIDEDNTINSYTTLQNNPPYNYNICGPCDGLYYSIITRILVLDSIPSLWTTRDSTEEYRIPPRSLANYPLSVLIYSLRNDSWRYVRDLSKCYYLRENSSYTFVDTSYYWLGSNDNHHPFKYDVIIVVNLATEAIEEIGLPETRLKNSLTSQSYSECLMDYHSTIALVALYKDDDNFDIWTLKERSWSKQLSVKLDCCVQDLLGYDDSKELRVIPVIRYDYCSIVSTYMESLVPLNDQEFLVEWERHRLNDAVLLGPNFAVQLWPSQQQRLAQNPEHHRTLGRIQNIPRFQATQDPGQPGSFRSPTNGFISIITGSQSCCENEGNDSTEEDVEAYYAGGMQR